MKEILHHLKSLTTLELQSFRGLGGAKFPSLTVGVHQCYIATSVASKGGVNFVAKLGIEPGPTAWEGIA